MLKTVEMLRPCECSVNHFFIVVKVTRNRGDRRHWGVDGGDCGHLQHLFPDANGGGDDPHDCLGDLRAYAVARNEGDGVRHVIRNLEFGIWNS